MDAPQVILQLIVTAKFGEAKKALLRMSVDSFSIPINCTPIRDKEMWVEDMNDAVDRDLGHHVSFKIMAECRSTPFVRAYEAGQTKIIAFSANFPHGDIGIDPEKQPSFTWMTVAEIAALQRLDEEARTTLLLALS